MEEMETSEAIYARRSIRRFTKEPVSISQIYRLVDAATHAPSAKNRQPWFFYIVHDAKSKEEFIACMNTGIDALYEKYCRQSIPRPDIIGAKNSVQIMEQADVIILVQHIRRYGTVHDDGVAWNLHALDIEVADLLSIGAAVQNMLLAAEEMDLGTLWMCVIFYAYPEVARFLHTDAPVLSAICVGHPDEKPANRPRLSSKSVSIMLQEKERQNIDVEHILGRDQRV